MWICNSCHTENEDNDIFCIECSTAKTAKPVLGNHCSNPECMAYHTILPNSEQKYCGKCGSPTTYQKEIDYLI